MQLNLFVCLVLLGTSTTFVRAACCCPEVPIPTSIDKTLSDTITDIILILDDALLSVRTKQALTIPVFLEMHRAIGQKGPVVELLEVDGFVYERFLTDVDQTFTALSGSVTTRFREGIAVVQTDLKCILPSCEFVRVMKLIQSLVDGLKVYFKTNTSGSRDRFWALYKEVDDKILKLHDSNVSSEEEYINRLEDLLRYGTRNFNRYVNAGGYSNEQYLQKVDCQIRAIIKEALQPKCYDKILCTDGCSNGK